MALEQGRNDEAKQYWASYLALDPSSGWADIIRRELNMPAREMASPSAQSESREAVEGMPAGGFKDEIPKAWGPPSRVTTVGLTGSAAEVRDYDDVGVTLVCEGFEASIVAANEACKGRTARGISVGSSQEKLIQAYGYPSRCLNTTQGECWAYDSQRIVFKIHAGKVLSWLIFSRA